MDEEPASEALDGDVDSNDEGPDSMDILMGEIEIPCDINNIDESYLDKKLSPIYEQPLCNDFPDFEKEIDKKELKDNYLNEKTPVNINSLKRCQGYTIQRSSNDQLSTSYGFIRSGELQRTIKGSDPLSVPKEWKFTVSSFVVRNEFDSLQECLDGGIRHFIKSLNRLENLVNDVNQKQLNSNEGVMNNETSSSCRM